MKFLVRSIIIGGLITVLTPCDCVETSRWLGASCHGPAEDCCGGPDLDLHSSMDQKALAVPSAQPPPPMVVVTVERHLAGKTPSVDVFLEVTRHSRPPPAYSPPLRI
jgi:hypothetical protein